MNKPAIISCSIGYSQLRNSKEDKILLRDLLYHLFFFASATLKNLQVRSTKEPPA